MSFYKTNYSRFLSNSLKGIFSLITSSWRHRSISLLSLLSGFYLASFFLSYLLTRSGYRVFVVILVVLLIELLVRARNSFNSNSLHMLWVGLDNLRIGITYAIVLEAFKLGS